MHGCALLRAFSILQKSKRHCRPCLWSRRASQSSCLTPKNADNAGSLLLAGRGRRPRPNGSCCKKRPAAIARTSIDFPSVQSAAAAKLFAPRKFGTTFSVTFECPSVSHAISPPKRRSPPPTPKVLINVSCVRRRRTTARTSLPPPLPPGAPPPPRMRRQEGRGRRFRSFELVSAIWQSAPGPRPSGILADPLKSPDLACLFSCLIFTSPKFYQQANE